MAEPFIGQIIIVGFNFAPRGYATCDGQLMSIAQNTALFSLLGTTYGGNGQTTFGLPDLRGRVPIHFGQGPGLSPYTQGEMAGEQSHTLITPEVPAHSHPVIVNAACSTEDADQGSPKNNFPAAPNVVANGGAVRSYAASANASMGASSGTAGVSGGNQPHNNLQPYLVLNFCIALSGIFPSRN